MTSIVYPLLLTGTIINNPLLVGDTILSSPSLAQLPVVAAGNTSMLTLNPYGASPEIIAVTAHTVGATTATIVRAQAGTVAVQIPSGTPFGMPLNPFGDFATKAYSDSGTTSLQTRATSLETSRTADELAIVSLQTSRTADELAIVSLQTSRTADELAIVSIRRSNAVVSSLPAAGMVRGDCVILTTNMKTYIYYGATTGWRQPWGHPWGIQALSNYGAADNVYAVGNPPTSLNLGTGLVFSANRWYRMGVHFPASAGGTGTATVRARHLINGIVQWVEQHMVSTPIEVQYGVTPPLSPASGGSLSVSWTLEVFTNNVYVNALSFQNIYGWVEDIGSNGNAPTS